MSVRERERERERERKRMILSGCEHARVVCTVSISVPVQNTNYLLKQTAT